MQRVTTAAARRRASPPDRARTGAHRVLEGNGVAPLILVVDDVEDTYQLYAEAVLEAGWRVAVAVDGEHALWKIRALKPDLVIMDLAMPILDGLEAMRQSRAHPPTTHIPIIVVTGQTSPDMLAQAREAGAEVVLTKPCTPDEVLAEVRKILNASG